MHLMGSWRVQHCLWGEGRGWACVNWKTPTNAKVSKAFCPWVLTICMENQEIPGRIQVEIFRKKVIPIEVFRAEKRNKHAWTFLPRSPGRVWKNGRVSNIFLPKDKMFPLITWKEQAVCLQKLQAVVITFSLLDFLEEYLVVKQSLTTSISLRCTGNVHA